VSRDCRNPLGDRHLSALGSSPRNKPAQNRPLSGSGKWRAASAKGVDGGELDDTIQSLLRNYHNRAVLLISSDASSHRSLQLKGQISVATAHS
jgi:hypothetical protein